MKREELLKSREYWISKIQIDVFTLIENYRIKKKITKTQLAQELGVTKGYITQILNGDFDHKMSKLVDLAIAFGAVPVLRFEDFKEYCEDDELGTTNLPYNERPRIILSLNNSFITTDEKTINKEIANEYY